MTDVYRNLVWRYAVLSRLVFMYFSAVCNSIFPDHESVDAFKAMGLESSPKSQLDNVINFFVGGLSRWDAQHFFHISQYGYTFENNLAFFPLYPLLLRLYSSFLGYFLDDFINRTSLLLVSSVFINVIFFARASVCLYDLTDKLYHNSLFAYKAAMFFCLSPATVFFIAPYSETLFSYCVFKGMLQNASNNLFYSTVWFALSCSIRSNGILNAGFVVHSLLFNMTIIFKPYLKITLDHILHCCKICCLIFWSTVAIFTPYFLFQYYAYYLFCLSYNKIIPRALKDYAVVNNLTMPSNETDWCHHKLPLPYFHIQNKYWSVGFLQYYNICQIPNFVLATPIIIMVLCYAYPYIISNRALLLKPKLIYKPNIPKPGQFTPTLPRCVFVYVVHAAFLTLFCTAFINVQVTTRILASSSPVIYWIASGECIKFSKHFVRKPKKSKSFLKLLSGSSATRGGMYIRYFFIIYAVGGVALFSNALPWT